MKSLRKSFSASGTAKADALAYARTRSDQLQAAQALAATSGDQSEIISLVKNFLTTICLHPRGAQEGLERFLHGEKLEPIRMHQLLKVYHKALGRGRAWGINMRLKKSVTSRLAKFTGNILIRDLSQNKIEAFFRKVAKRIHKKTGRPGALNTLVCYRSAVDDMLTFCQKNHWLPIGPTAASGAFLPEGLANDGPHPKSLSSSEALALVEATARYEKWPWLFPLTVMRLYLAAHLREIMRTQRKCLADGIFAITVEAAAIHAPRPLPMPPGLLVRLQAHFDKTENSPEASLCPGIANPLQVTAKEMDRLQAKFEQHLRACCKAGKLPYWKNMLRTTAVSAFMKLTRNNKLLTSAWMGSDERQIPRYWDVAAAIDPIDFYASGIEDCKPNISGWISRVLKTLKHLVSERRRVVVRIGQKRHHRR